MQLGQRNPIIYHNRNSDLIIDAKLQKLALLKILIFSLDKHGFHGGYTYYQSHYQE